MTITQDAAVKIYDHSEIIEERLAVFKDALGEDYKSYRGHIYRVLTYTMHFLGGDESSKELIETALVYHDIALWTHKELAYLEPSEALALADNKKHNWGLDPDALEAVIRWHHKITSYRGKYQEVVEAVRRADWIDASGGARRMGLTKEQVQQVEDAVPNYGFDEVLKRLTVDLGGSALAGNLKFLRHVFKL